MAATLSSACHLAISMVRSALLAVALAGGGASPVLAQVRLPEEFVEQLTDGGLTFKESLFKGYVVVPVIENRHMNYELALGSANPRTEVRYAIRRYDRSPKDAAVKPEMMAEPIYTTTLWNIAEWTMPPEKGGEPKIFASEAYPVESVRAEFHAAWGASALLVPRKEFAAGFDRCLVSYIYKGRTSAFAFYMFNAKDTETAMNAFKPIYYAMQFR